MPDVPKKRTHSEDSMKKAVSAPFTKGVNFSNWMEHRPADQINTEAYTRTDFENVKKLGCDVVRIPIHFEKLCGPAPDFAIPEKIMNLLDKIALWAEELKIHVVFDFHNATNTDSFTSPAVEQILQAVWTQMAEHFADSTDYLVFELMNEPHGIEIPVWNRIIERVFNSVRKIDTKHYIIVGGADWNSFSAMKTLPDFKDSKIIYTFHFYDPHTFTHQGATWCHMERVTGIPFPYDAAKMPEPPADATEYELEKFRNYPQEGTLEKMQQFFDQYVEFSIERNAPVYCGEFGCFAPFAKPEERVNWYRITAEALESRNVARTSWDYFHAFGIFDYSKIRGLPMEEIRNYKWNFPEDLNRDIVRALKLTLPE